MSDAAEKIYRDLGKVKSGCGEALHDCAYREQHSSPPKTDNVAANYEKHGEPQTAGPGDTLHYTAIPGYDHGAERSGSKRRDDAAFLDEVKALIARDHDYLAKYNKYSQHDH